jgi:hypothetical protein
MSKEKRMLRIRYVTRLGAIAASAAIQLAGCATKSDGDGSETHFLCTADSDCEPHGDGYRCVERTCTTVAGPEGSDTSCFDDTRARPYSPGMVFPGSNGVTVALTSTPAPPSLGDNTWTFSLTDGVGAPVFGATITAEQEMIEHRHGGSKAIGVTDIGGGSYRAAPVNFNMSGYWETTLHVVKAPIDDGVVIKLCVQ